MTVSTCVKNRGLLILPQDPTPSSLRLQGERVLDAHPPSCHPRRVFGCPENGNENERK